MFGDQLIIGSDTRTMDDKGRIFIPQFTNVEPGDELVLKQATFRQEQCLKIYALKTYMEIINRLIQLKSNATSYEEYKKYEQDIEEACYGLTNCAKVTSYSRILIPKFQLTRLNWEPNKEYDLYGLGESLLVKQKNSHK